MEIDFRVASMGVICSCVFLSLLNLTSAVNGVSFSLILMKQKLSSPVSNKPTICLYVHSNIQTKKSASGCKTVLTMAYILLSALEQPIPRLALGSI